MDTWEMVSPDAETAYRAMIKNPGWGADELRRELGWTVEAIQSALDELSELALIRRTGGGGDQRLTAMPPRAALASTIARAEADLARRERRVVELGRLLAS